MRASEFIIKLQEMIDLHGDLDMGRAYEDYEAGTVIMWENLDHKLFLY